MIDPTEGMSDADMQSIGRGIVERNERRIAAILATLDCDPDPEFIRRNTLLRAVLLRDWRLAAEMLGAA